MQRINLIPKNAVNLAWQRNKTMIETREAIRLEYLTWIIHFFNHKLDDAAIVKRMGKLTFKDLETAMLLYIRHHESKQKQEQREEERRQKELLDKLKASK